MPPRTDFTSQRLYIDAPMAVGDVLALDKAQGNYLINVLRMDAGDGLLVFNGCDGEWRAAIRDANRKAATLELLAQTRAQPAASAIWLCFAPIKSQRLDYMVQKAVEMGAGRLVPVITRRTQSARLNVERLRANMIEAAEQCGVLSLPELGIEAKLPAALASLEADRVIVFCDELAELGDPREALSAVPRGARAALFIGPEGGFDAEERAMLLGHPQSVRLALGPRILRAETAAIAGLAALQMCIGDWT
ncbi:MAG: 16S rRNA (uracil(1498)-N(3))-methyltransferase [Beijerinckiaceae bacterium]